MPVRLGLVPTQTFTVRKVTPSASIWATRRSMWDFSILKSGDAVTQQATDAGALLEDGDIVADARQLLGGGQPAGPEPTTAIFLPVLVVGGWGTNPAVFPGLVDDGVLDGLDAHRDRC